MLDNLTLTLLGITSLFVIMLILKETLPKKLKDRFCVICVSVSLTWIILLGLFFTEIFADKTIIAMLMGMSATGLFYLFYEKLSIFKLPLLLTFIFIIYIILENFILESLYFLVTIWALFTVIYLFRKDSRLKSQVNKLIECCRKW